MSKAMTITIPKRSAGRCRHCHHFGSSCTGPHVIEATEASAGELHAALVKARAALKEVRHWNNQDIRNFEDIQPDLDMLRARKTVIAQGLK